MGTPMMPIPRKPTLILSSVPPPLIRKGAAAVANLPSHAAAHAARQTPRAPSGQNARRAHGGITLVYRLDGHRDLTAWWAGRDSGGREADGAPAKQCTPVCVAWNKGQVCTETAVTYAWIKLILHYAPDCSEGNAYDTHTHTQTHTHTHTHTRGDSSHVCLDRTPSPSRSSSSRSAAHDADRALSTAETRAIPNHTHHLRH